jgi:hypothetical protein
MPTGIILLDKPQGLTSNGALQRVRRAYGAESAGHVGTLDPMATGMLPLCLDEATKVIAEIESGGKCYEFTVQLGTRTDTGDAEGQVVEQQPIPPFDSAALERVLTQFRGTIQQVPPMYSALKRNGRPLYELARKGIEVAPRAGGLARRLARPGLRMRQGHLHPGARRRHSADPWNPGPSHAPASDLGGAFPGPADGQFRYRTGRGSGCQRAAEARGGVTRAPRGVGDGRTGRGTAARAGCAQ